MLVETSGSVHGQAAIDELLAAVPSWWASRAHAVGLPWQWQEFPFALPAPPPEHWYATEADLPDDPFAVGEAYVRATERHVRSERGLLYTPRRLAEALWSELEREKVGSGRIVDPACGAGALLIPGLRRFVSETTDPRKGLADASQRFRGTDLDPVGVWLGNVLLAAELLPLWAAVPPRQREPLPQLLAVADGLRLEEKPDVIVMNPPLRESPPRRGERVRWQASLYGHANRYSLFMHAAVEAVRPGGLVAALVPTSFLGGAYFQRLRSYLSSEAPPVQLTFVDSRSGVFAGDVLQQTCLVVLRKGGRGKRVSCAQLTVNGAAHRTTLPPAFRLEGRAGDPWPVPRREDDGPLLERATSMSRCLADFGWSISTGPLVWNRHRDQISTDDREGAVPILWAADIGPDGIQRDRRRDRQRWVRLRERDAFMRLGGPAVLVQRTTAPEQTRRLVAALLDGVTLANWGGHIVVENHVNVLTCADLDTPLSPELLVELLNCSTLDRLDRCLTGSVAVSAYELAAIPLPDEETLRGWSPLRGPELEASVGRAYGTA